MTKKYNFNQLPNRAGYYEVRYDQTYIKDTFNISDADVLDFSIADINFETPPAIVAAIKNRADKKTYSYSYGSKDTIAAIKTWYQDWHKIDLTDFLIKIAHTTVNAMHQIVQEFSAENDNILLMTPSYKPFARVIINNNRNPIANKLLLNNNSNNLRYQIDFQQLEQQIVTYKVKLLMLCSPHNPSSQVWTKEELIKLVTICKKHNILIFADEIHGDIAYKEFTSMLALDYDNLIVANSPNKAFNLAGLQTCYLITKNKDLFTRITNRYHINSVTDANVFVNAAFQAAYLNDDIKQWIVEFKEYVNSNFEYLKANLVALGLQVFDLESTYLVWVKLPCSSKKLFEELLKKKIIILYGENFYDCPDQFIRINIATSKTQVKALIEQLKQINFSTLQ